MDEPWKHANISQTQKDKRCMIPLYEVPRIGKFLEIETRRVSQELRKQGNGEIPFNGHRVSVWDDDQVLEMDNGEDYTILSEY